MKTRKKLRFPTTHIIMAGFLLAILVGSLLLALPISAADGVSVPYIDALFTATTATCVTGLVTLPTVSAWSVFGQAVILVLIQIGGLGIVTILSGLMLLLHKKMGLGERLVIQDALNLNTLSGLAIFIKRILCGTFLIEGAGALLYMTVFVPEFGVYGIWVSLFTAVSAFCNAGIDIIAEDSLCAYATNPTVNLVTILLIVLGGIGYLVWWDVVRVIRSRKGFRFLTLHSKIAITATLGLIVVGAVLILAFEYHNPLTIGDISLFDKIQVSLFQSVTTRTAGFASVPQEDLTNASAGLSVLLMFIGGSPVSTAGGIKTVTLVTLIASAVATCKNRNEVTLFRRNISMQTVRKAVAVAAVSFAIMFLSFLFLAAVTDADALDVLYEVVSATATVGLSRGLTPVLGNIGKVIVIVTMYLGRVGPISLALALSVSRKNQNIIKNPTEEISVG